MEKAPIITFIVLLILSIIFFCLYDYKKIEMTTQGLITPGGTCYRKCYIDDCDVLGQINVSFTTTSNETLWMLIDPPSLCSFPPAGVSYCCTNLITNQTPVWFKVKVKNNEATVKYVSLDEHPKDTTFLILGILSLICEGAVIFSFIKVTFCPYGVCP